MPQISVIMSTYNTPAHYLRKSIESILHQTFKDFELIIIIDGSSNNDLDIINSYEDNRIKVITNSNNEGLAKSLNKGIRESTGKYIARMDSDDISIKNRLMLQYNYMEKNEKIDVLGGRALAFGSKEEAAILDFGNSSYVRARLFTTCVLLHPSVMIRKSFLIENGYTYNEEMRRAQDYDLWIRMEKKACFHIMPNIILMYRCHQKQATVIDRDKQISVCKRIGKINLKKLNIYPSEKEIELHYALCGITTQGSINFTEFLEWGNRIVRANKEKHYFDEKLFSQLIINRVIVESAKRVKNREMVLTMKEKCMLISLRNIYIVFCWFIRNIKYRCTFSYYKNKYRLNHHYIDECLG